MTVVRYIDVALTIPDNEAETALATLRRFGLALGGLRRHDLYRIEVEAEREAELLAMLPTLETIYNPNKHVMSVRPDAEPRAGEVWIDEPRPETPAGEAVRVSGKVLPGVWRIDRLTAWHLSGDDGASAPPDAVAQATEALLCNSAFQRAQSTR